MDKYQISNIWNVGGTNDRTVLIPSAWDRYFHLIVEGPDTGDLGQEHFFGTKDELRRLLPELCKHFEALK